MDQREEQQGNQFNIELTEEIAEGMYANLVIISHSNAEFVLDFVRILPGVPKAKVKSRIVTTPQHAKRLLFALQENIMRFEQSHGIIDINENDMGGPPPFTFGGPAGIA